MIVVVFYDEAVLTINYNCLFDCKKQCWYIYQHFGKK